jgi:hypothetical protein
MFKREDLQLPAINVRKHIAMQPIIEESHSDLRSHVDMTIKLDNLVNKSSNANSKMFEKDKENTFMQGNEAIQNQSNTAVFLMKKKQLFEAYENLEKQKALFKESAH